MAVEIFTVLLVSTHFYEVFVSEVIFHNIYDVKLQEVLKPSWEIIYKLLNPICHIFTEHTKLPEQKYLDSDMTNVYSGLMLFAASKR